VLRIFALPILPEIRPGFGPKEKVNLLMVALWPIWPVSRCDTAFRVAVFAGIRISPVQDGHVSRG
jgi:hypothetical protein